MYPVTSSLRRCEHVLFFIFTTTAVASTISENVNGTSVEWFWPSDNSIKYTYSMNDLINVSWTTSMNMMPVLILACDQAGQNSNPGLGSDGYVTSNGYRIVDLNLYIGPSHPYTCHFDFQKAPNSALLGTPSATFIISGNTSEIPVVHAEGNQNFTILTSAASTSASTTAATPICAKFPSSSTATAAPVTNGISPGAVAGIVIGVALGVAFITGAIARSLFRAARQWKTGERDDWPLWQGQQDQPENSTQTMYVASERGSGQTAMVEKDVAPDGVVVGGMDVRELDGGDGRR